MTIDAKKIIPKLSVSLEDEWEKLKEIRNWGAILETYDNIIDSVGWFIDSATRIEKQNYRRHVEWMENWKRRMEDLLRQLLGGTSNRSYYLEPRLKTNYKEKMNYYVPIQYDDAYE